MRVNELAVLVAHDRKEMQQEGKQRQFSHEIESHLDIWQQWSMNVPS